MVMLPAVAGFFIGGPNLDTLWLLATWAVCYCVQFSAAHWFKAHFSRRYLPPMLTYAVALIVIVDPTPKAVDSLMHIDLPADVNIEIKL